MRFSHERKLPVAVQEALDTIDVIALGKYPSYRTTGFGTVYGAKSADAVAYFRDQCVNAEDHPWVWAEAQARNCSMEEAAQVILNAARECTAKDVAVEQVRQQAKIAIRNAKTVKEVRELVTSFSADLAGI